MDDTQKSGICEGVSAKGGRVKNFLTRFRSGGGGQFFILLKKWMQGLLMLV